MTSSPGQTRASRGAILSILVLLFALLSVIGGPAGTADALTGSGTRLHDPSDTKVGSCWCGYSTGFENDPQNPSGSITIHRSCDANAATG